MLSFIIYTTNVLIILQRETYFITDAKLITDVLPLKCCSFSQNMPFILSSTLQAFQIIRLCINHILLALFGCGSFLLFCNSDRLSPQVILWFHFILYDHTVWHIFLSELLQLSLSGYYYRIREQAGGEPGKIFINPSTVATLFRLHCIISVFI